MKTRTKTFVLHPWFRLTQSGSSGQVSAGTVSHRLRSKGGEFLRRLDSREEGGKTKHEISIYK